MQVRVLGCSGAIARDCRTTSFLLDADVLVDAGTGVGDLTLDEMAQASTMCCSPTRTSTISPHCRSCSTPYPPAA